MLHKGLEACALVLKNAKVSWNIKTGHVGVSSSSTVSLSDFVVCWYLWCRAIDYCSEQVAFYVAGLPLHHNPRYQMLLQMVVSIHSIDNKVLQITTHPWILTLSA